MFLDLFRVATDDKYHFRYEIQLFRTIEDKYVTTHDKYEAYVSAIISSMAHPPLPVHYPGSCCLPITFWQIFESFAKPRLYWFGVKMFQKTDNGPWRFRGYDRPGMTSGVWETEYHRFQDFFKLKTEVEWRDRVIMAGTTEKIHFSYTPPVSTSFFRPAVLAVRPEASTPILKLIADAKVQTRGKPVGGSLRYRNYDECARRNRKLRIRWAELFGDELPADLAIEVAVKKILKDTINEACDSLGCADLCHALEDVWPDGTAQENSSMEAEPSEAPEGGYDQTAGPGTDELEDEPEIETGLSGYIEPAATPVSEVASTSSFA